MANADCLSSCMKAMEIEVRSKSLSFNSAGNKATDIDFCTHTNPSTVDPWLRVDLGSSKTITSVSLTNRGDCCGERLSNFEIRIGDILDDANGGEANPAISGSPFGVRKNYKSTGEA